MILRTWNCQFLPVVALLSCLTFDLSAGLFAADIDFRPGDVIGPHNWQKVEGMVGENLLNRIKAGYTFKIKEATHVLPPKEYREATKKYSRYVKLGSNGELLNYVAGLPFPDFNPNDSQGGLKLAWNFYWRWLGDDNKTGGGTEQGKIIRYAIERDGSERRADVLHHTIKTRGRVSLETRPTIPGYEHIDWMQLRADEYPRDTAGTTTLEIRYADANRDDDLYVYVPSIRRVRRVPPIQRCATIAPSEFTFDDINNFNGKITDFNYRVLGKRKMLTNFSQEKILYPREKGDYLPLEESWEVADAYVLEITPKNPDYCYPKKVIYIDPDNFEVFWTMMWDAKGKYWKELFGTRTVVELADGQKAQSVAAAVIVNVKNGRSTIVVPVRLYNQGYKPTLFTLATLQTVMRGGSIR
jgi:hypothetical protein